MTDDDFPELDEGGAHRHEEAKRIAKQALEAAIFCGSEVGSMLPKMAPCACAVCGAPVPFFSPQLLACWSAAGALVTPEADLAQWCVARHYRADLAVLDRAGEPLLVLEVRNTHGCTAARILDITERAACLLEVDAAALCDREEFVPVSPPLAAPGTSRYFRPRPLLCGRCVECLPTRLDLVATVRSTVSCIVAQTLRAAAVARRPPVMPGTAVLLAAGLAAVRAAALERTIATNWRQFALYK